jgi:hypothetical protein
MGPDAVNPDFNDKRHDEELEIGLLEHLADEINDPNDDGSQADSFANQYLLPMLGYPRKIGELQSGASDFLSEVFDKTLDPAQAVLGDVDPLEPLSDWIETWIKELVYEFVRDFVLDSFGVDINVLEFLFGGGLSTKMAIRSIVVDGKEFPLFRENDHDKLDEYLGFTGEAHLEPTSPSSTAPSRG